MNSKYEYTINSRVETKYPLSNVVKWTLRWKYQEVPIELKRPWHYNYAGNFVFYSSKYNDTGWAISQPYFYIYLEEINE